MSKWIDILKKNDKEFETTLKKDDTPPAEEVTITEFIDIRDPDDEFENMYSSTIHDIMFDFKDYIQNQQLPFMNKINMSGKYIIEDFFKQFTTNYIDLKNKVDQENEAYLKELEEEENELYEEMSDYEYKN